MVRNMAAFCLPVAGRCVSTGSRSVEERTHQHGRARHIYAAGVLGKLIQQAVACLLLTVMPAPLLGMSAAWGAVPSLQDCTTTSTPAYTVITCTRSGIKEGRPLPCGPLENCVSTSSVSTPTSFASPWLYDYETDNAQKALVKLVEAIEGLEGSEGLRVVETDPGRLYVRAEAPSAVPPNSVDDLEFVLLPNDGVVLYRSASRQSLLVYPLQQPVSDGGKIKKRLEKIQQAVNWPTSAY